MAIQSCGCSGFGNYGYILGTSIHVKIKWIFLQMVILYKDPDGEKIFRTKDGLETTVAVSDMELEKHCTELENRLSKYEVSECHLSTLHRTFWATVRTKT